MAADSWGYYLPAQSEGSYTTNTTGTIWCTWTDPTYSTTATDTLCRYAWSNAYQAHLPRQWFDWQAPANVTIINHDRRRHQLCADAERILEEEARQGEERKRRAEQALKASQKAEQLLLEHLTPQQREMYQKLKKFRIIGSDGRQYELHCDGRRYHNIQELDERQRRVVEHCIHQSGGTPLCDNYLAQKLLLEANAPEFRRIANQTRLVRA